MTNYHPQLRQACAYLKFFIFFFFDVIFVGTKQFNLEVNQLFRARFKRASIAFLKREE